MKMNIKSILKNNKVLYAVFVIAVLNIFGYIMLHNFDAVVLMFLVGFITCVFTKNMIVVLLVSLVVTNLFTSLYQRRFFTLKEGLNNRSDTEEEKEETEKNMDEQSIGDEVEECSTLDKYECNKNSKCSYDNDTDKCTIKKEMMTKLSPAKYNNDDSEGGADVFDNESNVKKPKVDFAATLEKAYDNLEKILGSGGMQKMSDHAEKLANKQGQLIEQMKTVEPMIQRAGALMEKFGGNVPQQ